MAKFDSKSFNPQAFGAYVSRVPNTKKNELIRSRALRGNKQIKETFSAQTTTSYARLPYFGNLKKGTQNYDGQTDITAQGSTTFERGVVVIGRADAWTEKDFSWDITSGVDFMDNVAQQIAAYWTEVDQDTLLCILKGIFSMSGAGNRAFTEGHTYDISNMAEGKNTVGETTLNSALQKASGDNKSVFTLALMHSVISTNLENLKLLKHLTYTDAQGIERELTLASWNGRAVLIDDSMPAVDGYFDASAGDGGAIKIVADTASPADGEIKLKDAKASYFGTKTLAAGDYVVNDTQYITYVLGEGAFDYEDIGAKVPYEMDRDPAKNGGEDTLYSRQRKVFAPAGISYEKESQATLSPTDAELANGANWTLVNDGGTGAARQYWDHKAIPIAQIKSRG